MKFKSLTSRSVTIPTTWPTNQATTSLHAKPDILSKPFKKPLLQKITQAVNFRLLNHNLIKAATRLTGKIQSTPMVSTAMQISQLHQRYQIFFKPMDINWSSKSQIKTRPLFSMRNAEAAVPEIARHIKDQRTLWSLHLNQLFFPFCWNHLTQKNGRYNLPTVR